MRDKKCQKCGNPDSKLDASHIFPKKTYPSMQFMPENAKLLCGYPCHLFWWHQHPVAAGEWIKDYLGEEKYEFLLKRSQETRTVNRVFLEQAEIKLKEKIAELMERE